MFFGSYGVSLTDPPKVVVQEVTVKATRHPLFLKTSLHGWVCQLSHRRDDARLLRLQYPARHGH